MANPRRTLPLGDALQPAIDRLKAIAAHSGDRLLLGDGPPNPDAALLDLCSEALHHLRLAAAAKRSRDPDPEKWKTAERRQRDDVLMAEYWEHTGEARRRMFRAKKMRAATAAGILREGALRPLFCDGRSRVRHVARRGSGEQPDSSGRSLGGRSSCAGREGLTMPQHDWQQWIGVARYCGDCDAQQRFDPARKEWLPPVKPICPGDGRDSSRRRRPAPSSPPAERTRELERIA